MKKNLVYIGAVSLGLVASPFRAGAQTPDASDVPTPTPSPSTYEPSGSDTKVKHHKDREHHENINEMLNKHPKLKEKVLAKFDQNHDGRLDDGEQKTFKKWREEHHKEWEKWKKESKAE